MKLAKFNIICMIDMVGGMSKDGAPPTIVPSWSKYLKEKTIGKKNNAIIMGRKTYQFMCGTTSEPFLANRENFVISDRFDQQEHTNIVVYKSLIQCLAGIGNRNLSGREYDDVWVLGGEKIFRECIKRFLPYCKSIIICKLYNESFDCDQEFPIKQLNDYNFDCKIEQQFSKEYQILNYRPNIEHQEMQFLKLLIELIDKGDKIIRNEYEAKSLKNVSLSYDISNEFPIITTRRLEYSEIVNTFIDDFDNLDFSADTIGFRLRTKCKFTGMKNYSSDNEVVSELLPSLITQGTKTLNLIREDAETNSRFIPSMIKFVVSPSKKYLHTTVVCNEMEMFKYFPYYLVYLSLLSNSVAYLAGLIPKKLFFFICDAQLKTDWTEFARKQILNDPKPAANILFKNISSVNSLTDLKKDNIQIANYDGWGHIKFEK